MSSTRIAAPGNELRQERFSSSKSLNKGLLGNLIARRCENIRSSDQRRLIYFLHELSLRDGYAVHRTCNLFSSWPWASTISIAESSLERVSRELGEMFSDVDCTPDLLSRICLDPGFDVTTLNCAKLFECLRSYEDRFRRAVIPLIADTAVKRTTFELLDYAREQRGIVLLEGTYRTGKSFSAQGWCQQHLGEARYCQLSSSTSDVGFYRDLARSVGIVTGYQRKAFELRIRIEEAIRGQQLLLVIDEAQYLWPQTISPTSSPERVNWLMTSAFNNGVPVALIASRNFSRLMANVERKCRIWGSEQFYGRIKLRKSLPDSLTKEDLTAVAKLLLANASDAAILFLVGHALLAKGHVAAMENVAFRAQYLAKQRDADRVEFEDVELALADAADSSTAAAVANVLRSSGEASAGSSRVLGGASAEPNSQEANFRASAPLPRALNKMPAVRAFASRKI